MFATAGLVAACFSVGLYFYHQGKKTAGEAQEKLYKAQIDKLNEKNENLKDKNDRYLEIIEKHRVTINKLNKQLLPSAAPVNKESSPPRTRSHPSADRESSPPRKGSSQIGEWVSIPRRRSRQPYGNLD
jgi:hypothetical protein